MEEEVKVEAPVVEETKEECGEDCECHKEESVEAEVVA